MFRHVRIIILIALVAAVAIGLALPSGRKKPETAQASQIPVMAIN